MHTYIHTYEKTICIHVGVEPLLGVGRLGQGLNQVRLFEKQRFRPVPLQNSLLQYLMH